MTDVRGAVRGAVHGADAAPGDIARRPGHGDGRIPAGASSPRPLLQRLPVLDRDALGLWVLSRIAMWTVAMGAGYLFATAGAGGVVPLLERWQQWDFHHYWGIALYGYGGEPTGVPNEAFFPAFPAALWLGHAVGLPHIVAGLLVSLLGGAVAVVALARLAALDHGPDAGRRSVLIWLLAPTAVFLAAPYTEALFLGLALPAWLAARRGRWALAGLLAAGAMSVRVSGVFLAAALVVQWLVQPDGGPWSDRWRRAGRELPWLAAPGAVLLGWMTYLRWLTGDWLAWVHAQEQEWRRELTPPWVAASHTWEAATGGLQDANFTWMFRAELVAMAVGVIVTVLLIAHRHWGEATWVGLHVAAFGTSYWFFSVPRATLLWWPLWIGLAVWSLRRRWVLPAYVAVCGPLMILWAATYLTGRWAG